MGNIETVAARGTQSGSASDADELIFTAAMERMLLSDCPSDGQAPGTVRYFIDDSRRAETPTCRVSLDVFVRWV